MTRYTRDSRDRVLEAVDMVTLVSARTELRRRGVDSYFGLCPFHEERTASFHVRPEQKHYHCFGCQVSGDPFAFVMETEGLDFKAALEALADRFGVKLETEAEDPEAVSRRQRRERLYSLLDRAATYYARYLWEANEAQTAREYLRDRGLGEQILKEFRVGYAPSAWDRMLLASRRAGFSDEELVAVGLAQRSRQGSVYDRFRGRVMFPSADARGRVLGFGARALRENQPPKYLNTSEGELYRKRDQLFGIDQARAAATRAGRVILVEGYTDVLALHQAGVKNAVGIMGTSLTEPQAQALERLARVLELCLDADSAGKDAMVRAAEMAGGRRLELRVVQLPSGVDPDELIQREGPDALQQRVQQSVPFVVFRVQRILDSADVHSAEGRDRAIVELRPVLSGVPPSSLRDELMRRIAGRLELPEGRLAVLKHDARARPVGDTSSPRSSPDRNPAGPRPTTDPVMRAERTFLVLCVALPEAGARALAAIDPDELITSELYRRAARHLAGQLEMPMSGLAPEDDELARLIADLVQRAGRGGSVSEARLDHARLLLELDRVDRTIARLRAERATRPEAALELADAAREREDVLESIRNVGRTLERTV